MPRPIPTLAFLIEEADIEREQEAAAIFEEERLEAAHLEKYYYSSFSDYGRYGHDHHAQDDFDDVDDDDSDVGSDYDDDWGDDQYYFNFLFDH